MPHQRAGSPPPPGANGAPRTQGHRPLPHTVPETTLPAALRASLDRLAGREPPRPPTTPTPPDRERSDA